MKLVLVYFLTLGFALSVSATEGEHKMPPPKTNKHFEQLKKLVGTWQGTTKNGDLEQAVTVSYELTSGGNIILEKLFPGTPLEMVSVYHPVGDSVVMTHYCGLGNQPKMTLKKSDANSLSFEMKGKDGISSAKELHMHALNIKWNSPTSITEEWTSHGEGKKIDTKILNFTKKQ